MYELKKSRFTITLPIDFGDESVICFYHTMSEAFVLVPEEEAHQCLQDLNMPVYPDTRDLLMKQGFFIRTDIDEKEVFNCWHQQHVHDFSIITSKVLVTRKCNNRCRYCIIESENSDMHKDTAVAMDRFYVNVIDEKKPGKVQDDYLGGEPLLNTDIILESAGRRFEYCKKMKIQYGFTITTNGTLLSPEIVREMKKKGLTGIRVSMAGPAAIHDFLRPSRNGENTFHKIMHNLKSVSGLIPITIECQYDSGSDDYQLMPEMMDGFKENDINISNVFFTPILAGRGAGAYGDGMGNPEIALFLNREAEKRGYGERGEAPSNLCRADFRSMFVFDTNGSIIPCPSVQQGEMAYGDVFNGVDFVSEALLINRRLPEKCLNQCDILPVCMGGCRLQALIKQNDFAGADCHYECYRFFLENYIKEKAMRVIEDFPE